jgi:hypothetical protein
MKLRIVGRTPLMVLLLLLVIASGCRRNDERLPGGDRPTVAPAEEAFVPRVTRVGDPGVNYTMSSSAPTVGSWCGSK